MSSKLDKIQVIQKLLSQKVENYAEAKSHSHVLDMQLGYSCEEVEKKLNTQSDSHFNDVGLEKQYWIGLDIQSLQTPYSELHSMCELIQPQAQDHWIDLGAAYGRLGIVLGFEYPLIKFDGFEYILERVDEGNRVFEKWNLHNSKMIQVDLSDSDFVLPTADVYFIYDFGSKSDIHSILDKLCEISKTRSIKLIARGRGMKWWVYELAPWLTINHEPIQNDLWTLFQS